MGYRVDVEEFDSRLGRESTYASYLALAGVGALLIVPAPLAACVFGLAGLLLYARDVEGRPLMRPRGGTSRNVLARSSELPPAAVVVAHVDSPSAGLERATRRSNLRGAIAAVQLCLFGVAVAGAAAWIASASRGLPTGWWAVAGILAVGLGASAATLVVSSRHVPLASGRNDNASGIEVLLRIAKERPADTWFVITGSSSAGAVGVQALLAAHGPQVGASAFVNVDSVGRGQITVLEEEGVLRSRRAPAEMVRSAERAGAEASASKSLPTDATVLLARHLRAVTVTAVPDEEDVARDRGPSRDEIDERSLDAATNVVRAILSSVLESRARVS
jgi:hypothetical protein